MRSTWLFACLAVGVVLVWTTPAMAQYRSTSFGFDVGYWLIQKPSITENGKIIASPDNRPLRLSNGWRLGGETNFKMSSDHWWFSGRVNVGILSYPDPTIDSKSTAADKFDHEASKALGTLLGVEAGIGVRYIIFTDRVRPYLQLSLSYLRLFTFADAAGADCSGADVVGCTDGSSNSTDYLPHPNVGGIHLQPGLEYVFTRDMAINVFADVQRWLLFNAPGNFGVVVGIGILWFT